MKRTRQGFTLIEMIVVLGIMALITTVTVVAFAPFFRAKTLDSAKYRVRSAILGARTYAVTYRVPVKLKFDTSENSMQLYHDSTKLDQPLYLPGNVSIEDLTNSPTEDGKKVMAITIAGVLGTVHGGDVNIQLKSATGEEAVLCVIKASLLVYSEQ